VREEITVRDIQKRGGRYRFTILGECVSMKNRRRIVKVRGKTRSVKSDKALAFWEVAKLQLRPARPLVEGPVRMWIRIFYVNPLSDLDESIVLDVLQGVVYVNDRQVFEVHKYKRFSKDNPRVEIELEELRAEEWEGIKTGLTSRARQTVPKGLAQEPFA